ncbi:hypothetical protein BJY59DRAFT_701392 [Rhodotorula toruloides]
MIPSPPLTPSARLQAGSPGIGGARKTLRARETLDIAVNPTGTKERASGGSSSCSPLTAVCVA